MESLDFGLREGSAELLIVADEEDLLGLPTYTDRQEVGRCKKIIRRDTNECV